jgi:hypothetical protein
MPNCTENIIDVIDLFGFYIIFTGRETPRLGVCNTRACLVFPPASAVLLVFVMHLLIRAISECIWNSLSAASLQHHSKSNLTYLLLSSATTLVLAYYDGGAARNGRSFSCS